MQINSFGQRGVPGLDLVTPYTTSPGICPLNPSFQYQSEIWRSTQAAQVPNSSSFGSSRDTGLFLPSGELPRASECSSNSSAWCSKPSSLLMLLPPTHLGLQMQPSTSASWPMMFLLGGLNVLCVQS